jgi:hypothetical protein
MHQNSASGFGLELRRRPDEGGDLLSSVEQVKNSLSHYSLLLAPGIVGGIIAHILYPPLAEGPIAAFGFCVLLFPLILYVRSIWRNRLRADAEKLCKACVYSSLILTALVLLVLMNGFLDKSPRTIVRTVLIARTRHTSRSGSDYTLTVASWRARQDKRGLSGRLDRFPTGSGWQSGSNRAT